MYGVEVQREGATIKGRKLPGVNNMSIQVWKGNLGMLGA